MALPGRRTVSVHLRGRPGALLLTTAWLSWCCSGALHGCRYPSRVPNREGLRAPLHGFLRSPGVVYRPLARAANAPGFGCSGGARTARADRVALFVSSALIDN